jgi:hypothetical protein
VWKDSPPIGTLEPSLRSCSQPALRRPLRHRLGQPAGFPRPAGHTGAQAEREPHPLPRRVRVKQPAPGVGDEGAAGPGCQDRLAGKTELRPNAAPRRLGRSPLKRVFRIAIETCSACGGAVRIIACIADQGDPRSPRCESRCGAGVPAAAVSGAARAPVRLRRSPRSDLVQ